MDLFELLSYDNLKKGLDDGLINVRISPDGQRILNYSPTAMYTPGSWDNPAVRACRGLIISPNNMVVARPWAKFFNSGELADLDLDSPVEVTDKADGSLGILHYDQTGGIRVAIRGSFLSHQAMFASSILKSDYSPGNLEPWGWWPRDFTPLVEIVYPENRIVLDYGAQEMLVLLGGVWHGGTYAGPDEASVILGWPGEVTKTFPQSTLRDALAMPPRKNAEGVCVRYLDRPEIVKIKQDDYVRLHKIVFGLTKRSVWQAMLDGGIEPLLDTLPDELHEWTKGVAEGLDWDVADTLADAVRTFTMIGETNNRKEFAEKAKRSDNPHILFRLYDNVSLKEIRKEVLQSKKPKADSPAKWKDEDVA